MERKRSGPLAAQRSSLFAGCRAASSCTSRSSASGLDIACTTPPSASHRTARTNRSARPRRDRSRLEQRTPLHPAAEWVVRRHAIPQHQTARYDRRAAPSQFHALRRWIGDHARAAVERLTDGSVRMISRQVRAKTARSPVARSPSPPPACPWRDAGWAARLAALPGERLLRGGQRHSVGAL